MRKKVMVIDDDENAVKFLSVLLSESGYEPIVAYDGKEGLQKIEEHAVDLIVLDVMMPKKTGFVLFKQAHGTRCGKRRHLRAALRQSSRVTEKSHPGNAGKWRRPA
jgi:CheY-like chemotaxis protein